MSTYDQLMRSRNSTASTDTNRYLYYTPEWYFAKYTGLTTTDLSASTPYKYGVTASEAVTYLPSNSGWNGQISSLTLDQAIIVHRAKYWEASLIGVVYSTSPVTVDILMALQSLSVTDEDIASLITDDILKLAYMTSNQQTEGEVTAILSAVTLALSQTTTAILLNTILFSSVLTKAITLKAPSVFLNKLILAKANADAVAKGYASA